MREEDKVLLLAEILGADTSKYVENYVEELRSSNNFMELCNNVSRARNTDSYKAQQLIDEFETIDFSKIDSLSKVFVLSAHINFLIQKSEESDYINPFFYNSDIDVIKVVGEIRINFDNKKFTLNDMILDERYTSNYKIDYIKECFLEWRKELVEKVREPLKLLVVKNSELPKIEILNGDLKLILFFVVSANICFFLAPFLPSTFVRNIYKGTSSSIVQNMFFVMVILMFVIDVFLVIFITNRTNKRYKFVKALKMIKNPYRIVTSMNNKCVNFYSYILNCLTNQKLLDESISQFSLEKKYVSSIACLIRILNKPDKSLEDNSFPFLLRLLLVMFFVLCAAFVLYLLYLLGRR